MSNKATDLLNLSTNNTAVLVIDKQRGYIERQEEDDTNTQLLNAVPLIDEFLEKSRELGLKIIWTQMIENRAESPENIKKILFSDPACNDRTTKGTKSYDFIGVKPLKDDFIVEKLYYDAFAKTELAKYLRANNIENVVLVGAYGSRCVLATAFGANGNDFNVILLKNLISNPDKYARELRFTSDIVDNILGWSINSEDFLKIIKH